VIYLCSIRSKPTVAPGAGKRKDKNFPFWSSAGDNPEKRQVTEGGREASPACPDRSLRLVEIRSQAVRGDVGSAAPGLYGTCSVVGKAVRLPPCQLELESDLVNGYGILRA
jgi:hypothetical protein